MQKIFLPILFVMTFVAKSKAQQRRLFDQHVQLKTCTISINANPFIATTVVEMEFYNPKDQEVEAYQGFTLNRGQVITDFQLELNGKYREGSIEERWKARQAYSSIVGKRIDPAILQMDWSNHYSLNIYPVAARSSRKVKFTIVQMMAEENQKLSYLLPLNFQDTTTDFKLNISVNRPASIPNTNKGLLETRLFDLANEEASLSWQANNILLNKPISFSIGQFVNQPQFCINKNNGHTDFLMRLYPDVPKYYAGKATSINVYWDVSLSGRDRNLSKEFDFLEKYISVNEISKMNIILFNHQVQGIIVFNPAKDNFSYIRNYLLTYKYAGATELGNLDFSNVLADAVLLFSDGVNSIGNNRPKLGAVRVSFITSTHRYDYGRYKEIVGNTGGSIINLNYTDIKNAVSKVDTSENFLFKYNAANVHLNESFPVKLGSSILLSGSIEKADNLELLYGNNVTLLKSENYFLPANERCDEDSYKKVQMLRKYDSLMYGYYNYYRWQSMIEFGLSEKVITPQTSYLVLERIEDYIKYKIAPPKELEEKCAEMNYVYRSEYRIKALKEFTEQEALESVVKDYNKRISWWSKDEPLMDLNKPVPEQKNIEAAANAPTYKGKSSSGITTFQNIPTAGPSELKEVVVTSAFGIQRTARSSTSSVQYISNDRVNTIRQMDVNNALAGKVAGAQIRSQSYAKLGAETMIRLRGENGLGVGSGVLYVVDGMIMSGSADINPDDIEDYSILQGPAATALFGPDGTNGAIVMTRKKARKGYPYSYYTKSEYKLKNAEDEDYVQEMNQASDVDLWDTFLELEKDNKRNIRFYFEMANFFFEKKKYDKAQELMYNAIELSEGNTGGLKLAAYMYEKWKQFDKAIAVYKGILSNGENDLIVKRDLALAYFLDGNFETAVKTYYSIITDAEENNYSNAIRENALAEMNAVILLHKNEFNISYINPNLIKALPVDLRITVESNNGYMSNSQIQEPDNAVCSSKNPVTKKGGRYTGNNYYNYYHNDHDINEYSIKKASTGSYRIKIDAYDYYYSQNEVPAFVRVIAFKNFQKENMQVEIKIFDLDNQYGLVELDEIRW